MRQRALLPRPDKDNGPQPILRCLEITDSDIHLLAGQYWLVYHDHAVDQLFRAARKMGVAFVMGPALNAGFLGGAPRHDYGADIMAIRDRAQLAQAPIWSPRRCSSDSSQTWPKR